MDGEPIDMKVVVIGTTSVGKTCIVQRATSGEFNEKITPTLGASYISKVIEVNNQKVNLQIWDTAGQERYKGMTPMYYRGAQAALIVYAVDSTESFGCIDEWYESVEKNKTNQVHYILVGNKCDVEKRVVSTEEGKNKADALGAQYYEVSALSGEGIDDLFVNIPKKFLEELPVQYHDEKNLKLEKQKDDKKGCC
ncbi:small GTP-binding protein, putative [Trichomonas vaginalis G3]|uniref:Small GTP-binding protein, putative n=1 Tax=Trichomonas vaginalis (strain ATCC PRA-98 / G3) TaxID=412133 RepID=A2D7C1_TRIV3|nr:GTPase protein [Trichomonas vaginalis G3]EAY23638.1 small GTP-binding protein, putative [Trichomonas vaginalis G3]KAI5490130.1 GTPase protein [Trichomonas vaginalis G3]|eukprot:XP_001276886.1 small GTP-binding protein [Trichomonas vaginalis G3]